MHRLAALPLALVLCLGPLSAAAETRAPEWMYYKVPEGARVALSWDQAGEELAGYLTPESGIFMVDAVTQDGKRGRVMFSAPETGWVAMEELTSTDVEPYQGSRLPFGLTCTGHAPLWSLTLDGAQTMEFFSASLVEPVTLTYAGTYIPQGAGPQMPVLVSWENETASLDATIGYQTEDWPLAASVMVRVPGNWGLLVGECGLAAQSFEWAE